MLRKQSTQKDFFDSYVYERLLPKKHILLDIRDNIDFSFVDKEAKAFYSADTRGRPPFPAEIIFKMLFLEFFYRLSDYEVVDQVRSNVLFRYFVGLGISEPTPDDTTLVKFRQRLGEEGFRRFFDKIVAQAGCKGLIKGNLKILDATHMSADIAFEGVVNLLRHGRKMIIKKISNAAPEKASVLKERFINENKLRGLPTNEQINQELNITREFITEVKDEFNKEAQELIELLETSLNQQQNKASMPKHKEPDEIISFTDKDARSGHKTPMKKFAGYKAHISLDSGSDIVTSVRTITGNRNEGANQEVKKLLIEDESKNINHEAVCADSLYDSYNNRKQIHSQNMRAFIPGRTKAGNRSRYLDNFIYNQEKDTIICPQGYSPISKTYQQEGTLYIFSTTQCRGCSSIGNCPTPNRDRIRLFVSNDYRLKLIDEIPYKKEALLKRKGIERKFGEAKKWHGLAKARYRQRWRVAIQSFMTFSVINIKKIAALLASTPEYALCREGFT